MAFDIYLFQKPGREIDRTSLADAISAEPWIRGDPRDPERFVYHREDTSVALSVLLERPLARAVRRRIAKEAEEGDLEPEGLPAEGDENPASEGADGGDEEDSEGEAEDEGAPPAEFAPVAITVPFFVPSFFLLEGLQLATRWARAAELDWAHAREEDEEPPEGSGEGATAPSFETLLELWKSEARAALASIGRPVCLEAWPDGDARAWWAYGDARGSLRAELGPSGVEVPILQLARHAGRLKTLCVWDARRATVLPRTDLVLLRRERLKKGLILSRRAVEEGIAPGAKIWDLLAPLSEIRDDPVRLLVFRPGEALPSRVAAELEVLECEPVEAARRASLFGVVDFDPRADSSGEAGGS